jgi:hypothetical protein
MNAVAHALLAVLASCNGDSDAAREHISSAHQQARATARRDRQVVEIAALAVAGQHERAAGLSMVHTAEFPDDADLLRRVTDPGR